MRSAPASNPGNGFWSHGMFPVLLDVTRSSSVAAAEEFSDLGRRLEGDLLSGEPLVGSLAVPSPLG